jgi:hypothetical protein
MYGLVLKGRLADPAGQFREQMKSRGEDHMSRKLTRKASSRFMALLLGIVAGVAQAAGPLPVNSNAYGKGYDELAANWLEWAISIPKSTNPIIDPTGAYAAMGQSGKVWFLAGTTGNAPAVTRTITVPSGAALFFPIVNYFWLNTPEYGDPPWSPDVEAWVRAYLAGFVDTYQNLSLTIDGKPVPNVETLRVASTVGSCTPPANDNIFGVPLDPTPHECVGDGFWALLPPLSVGKHTIRFTGGFTQPVPFTVDVKYEITVQPRQKVDSMKAHP